MANEVEILRENQRDGNNGVPLGKSIYQLLSSDGKGGGVVNLNAAAPAAYTITPESHEVYVLKRMNVWQVDANFNAATGYGAGSALTNGITITVENASGIIVNYTPVSIKTSFEWALLAGVDIPVIGGAGADALPIRWTFNKGDGNIILDGSKGEFLKVSFGDAMNFMDHLRIMVQGYKK